MTGRSRRHRHSLKIKGLNQNFPRKSNKLDVQRITEQTIPIPIPADVIDIRLNSFPQPVAKFPSPLLTLGPLGRCQRTRDTVPDNPCDILSPPVKPLFLSAAMQKGRHGELLGGPWGPKSVPGVTFSMNILKNQKQTKKGEKQ